MIKALNMTFQSARASTGDDAANASQQLTPEEFRSIQWDPNAPTWEEYVQAGKHLREAEKEHEAILRAKERAARWLTHGDSRIATG